MAHSEGRGGKKEAGRGKDAPGEPSPRAETNGARYPPHILVWGDSPTDGAGRVRGNGRGSSLTGGSGLGTAVHVLAVATAAPARLDAARSNLSGPPETRLAGAGVPPILDGRRPFHAGLCASSPIRLGLSRLAHETTRTEHAGSGRGQAAAREHLQPACLEHQCARRAAHRPTRHIPPRDRAVAAA